MLPIKFFIASSRIGVWEVNQYAKAEFLPTVFATNRSIYSKYMSYMILQRKHLPADVMDGFQEGLFVSKLSEGNFNFVWIFIGRGGIIKLVLKGQAMARWLLTSPVTLTAKYSMQFHKNVCKSQIKSDKMGTHHHSDTTAAKKQFDKDVQSMTQMFEGSFIDPFDLFCPYDHLVNFATVVTTLSE